MILRMRHCNLTVILLFVMWLKVEAQEDTVSFVHISDVHFCNLNGYHPAFVDKRKHYGNIRAGISDFFRDMPKQYDLDFIAITGDMVDFYEAESETGFLLGTQIEQFAEILDVSDVPVYMSLGNHDITSYWIEGDSEKLKHQDHVAKARATWSRNIPCFKNGTYYSKTVRVGEKTFRLIFLENGYYSDDRPKEGPHYIMDETQMRWLDRELGKSEEDIELIFMHMPVFDPAIEDIESSRNSYYVNDADTIPLNFSIKTAAGTHPNRFYEVLDKHSSVRMVFNGHKHSSAIHEIHFSDDYSVTQVTTGSFNRDQRNWRKIELTEDSILVFFPGKDNLQISIPLFFQGNRNKLSD